MDPHWKEQYPEKINVLLVDSHASVRELLAIVLNREQSFSVYSEASTGGEGISKFRKYRPKLVITELLLPEMSGPHFIDALRSEGSDSRILVYTGTNNLSLVRAGLESQPHGFVHKRESLNVLRHAYHAVGKGFSFFSPFATTMKGEIGKMQKGDAPAELSPKHRMILFLVVEGLTTIQIAERLALSPKTVEHYRAQAMKKLGLSDIVSLMRYAFRSGLIDIE